MIFLPKEALSYIISDKTCLGVLPLAETLPEEINPSTALIALS